MVHFLEGVFQSRSIYFKETALRHMISLSCARKVKDYHPAVKGMKLEYKLLELFFDEQLTTVHVGSSGITIYTV